MKLNQKQLRKLINEEVQKMNESSVRADESQITDELYNELDQLASSFAAEVVDEWGHNGPSSKSP